ncbi:DUF1707 SHOCT-like domain-containing protein [Corynebacterium pygosceleis]|uniref:DUF1707 domain-containing protein n=1 Tax=Corynebacterium pygosceleis TaxID=2800406 RepID=A0A9Q4GJC5_9CORY|nr:DUF1707 domain-containing protein [Corynebacterium pygosceleis]MCK7637667.1 DUF1707 domain-containing protein [Corynebacterium pygosceleis]MCK7674858.1 DUF1707 domain-containing protein [Corynebacterium pygosceleis]MCL0119553.1 DUF1707 domain-containing protein [Corynebacterium pygosceleis]MCX7468004.1 DUF1707 domain-containing protein [Corynebacterium pygosceleis]
MKYDVPRQPTDPGALLPARETRIGDTDRTRVLEALAGYLESGHLTITDFEERSAAVPGCRTTGDLEIILADLPAGGDAPASTGSGTASPSPGRVSGIRTRIGVFLTVGVLCMTATAATASPLPLVVWALTAIALFILNVGPDSWYTPSLRQLERRALRADGHRGR